MNFNLKIRNWNTKSNSVLKLQLGTPDLRPKVSSSDLAESVQFDLCI